MASKSRAGSKTQRSKAGKSRKNDYMSRSPRGGRSAKRSPKQKQEPVEAQRDLETGSGGMEREREDILGDVPGEID